MENQPKDYIIPQRGVIALLAFFGIVNAYAMRVCLSVAIVDIVPTVNHTNNLHLACERVDEIKEKEHHKLYEWSEELQGYILSSFYIGYFIMHIPGGYLADIFGPKWVYGIGLFVSAILTLLTPLTIKYGGAIPLIILRAIMGLGQSVTYPSATVLLSKWAPLKERGKIGAFILGAGPAGIIVSNSLSGLIIAEFSWHSVFYFFGVLAIIWLIFFYFLCYNNPQEHPFIKPGELAYLEQEMGITVNSRTLSVPYLAILSNVPVIVLIIAQVGHDFGLYAIMTDLPKYMADVIGLSIKENGLYSSMPYILMWIVTLVSGVVGDWLITSGTTRLAVERNIMTGIGAFGPAIFIVAASYAGCDRTLVIAFFTLGMGCMGSYYAGMKLSPVDLSPNFSGTLMALTNGIGALAGFLAPTVVGYMAPDSTLNQWRGVFWVTFGMLVGTVVIYYFAASSDVQDFNDPDYVRKRNSAK